MTRSEFVENIKSWHDLLSFCHENDMVSCDFVYNSSEAIGIIRDELNNEGISGVVALTSNIYYAEAEYFYYGDYGLENLDDYDDFERFKEQVFDEALDDGYFEDEECNYDLFDGTREDTEVTIDKLELYAILNQ